MKRKSWVAQLRRKSERKGSVDAIGTIAFYGPDSRHASKVAVAIVLTADSEVAELERWFEMDWT